MNKLKNQQMVITLIAVLVVGAAAFFGGVKYQQAQAASPTGGRQLQADRQGGRQGRPNGGAVVGDIISLDDKSITVKLPDGSSKIVLLPDNVTISKTDSGSKTDLKTGVRVGVFGTTNSDGSVTAQSVQLNPMFRAGGPNGSAMPSGSAR